METNCRQILALFRPGAMEHQRKKSRIKKQDSQFFFGCIPVFKNISSQMRFGYSHFSIKNEATKRMESGGRNKIQKLLLLKSQWLCLSHFLFSQCSMPCHLKLEFLVFVSMNCLMDDVCKESKNANEAPENA